MYESIHGGDVYGSGIHAYPNASEDKCNAMGCSGDITTACLRLVNIGWDPRNKTCDDIKNKVCNDCTIFVPPDPTRTALCPSTCGGSQGACDAARAVMKQMDSKWASATCDQVTCHVCCEAAGQSLFTGNNSIRTGLCGNPSKCPTPGCSSAPPTPPCTCADGTSCPGGALANCKPVKAPGQPDNTVLIAVGAAAVLGIGAAVLLGQSKRPAR